MAADYKTEPIIGTSIRDRWGLDPVQYAMTVDGETQLINFQDMMIYISLQRANALEGEVKPLADRVQARNAKLNAIGNAISELSRISPTFDTKDPDPHKIVEGFSAESIKIFEEVYALANLTCPKTLQVQKPGTTDIYKSTVDEATQKLKSWSERLNNESQLNMSRMNTVIDNRDKTFNTATTMMNSISDTMGFVIKSMN